MLTLLNLHKSYTPGVPVLAGVSLCVAQGEIVCLLGPSGCGKTTLLRVIAGLERAEAGSVQLDGRDLAQTPVHLRNFGFMFQDFALFPHRTVGENIAFGLRMAGQSRSAIAQRVDEMLELVNLQGYAARSIFELSGGERQRVALARSLAPNPRLLMLDEPLGSLDRSLREQLMGELRAILKRIGVTALYVTHDQQEAFTVADRVVLMNRGRVEQEGTPEAVYQQPRNEFVARFLGFQNLLPALLQATEEADRVVAETGIGQFEVKGRQPAQRLAKENMQQMLLIRPDALLFVGQERSEASSTPPLRGRIVERSFRGNHYQVKIEVVPPEPTAARASLQFEVANLQMLQCSDEWVEVRLDPQKIQLLDKL